MKDCAGSMQCEQHQRMYYCTIVELFLATFNCSASSLALEYTQVYTR